MITFQKNNKIYFKSLPLRKWLMNIILEEKKECGNIVYFFCDDEFILNKNKTYLKHDFYTDVITFDYSNKNFLSGDILISVDRIKENAQVYNMLFEKELQRVMAHAILHLAGYKDKTIKEKKIMREKENYYLKKHK